MQEPPSEIHSLLSVLKTKKYSKTLREMKFLFVEFWEKTETHEEIVLIFIPNRGKLLWGRNSFRVPNSENTEIDLGFKPPGLISQLLRCLFLNQCKLKETFRFSETFEYKLKNCYKINSHRNSPATLLEWRCRTEETPLDSKQHGKLLIIFSFLLSKRVIFF